MNDHVLIFSTVSSWMLFRIGGSREVISKLDLSTRVCWCTPWSPSNPPTNQTSRLPGPLAAAIYRWLPLRRSKRNATKDDVQQPLGSEGLQGQSLGNIHSNKSNKPLCLIIFDDKPMIINDNHQLRGGGTPWEMSCLRRPSLGILVPESTTAFLA